MSKTATRSGQASNTFEGLKLVAEAQTLSEQGTQEARREALQKYKAAYEIFRKNKYDIGIGTTLFAMGAIYTDLGQKRLALDSFLEASTYMKQEEDPSFYSITLAGIGMAYSSLSEWKPAVEFLNKAVALLKTEKNPHLLFSVLSTLGGIHIKAGQKQKGLEYLYSALSMAQEVNDPSLEINALLLIGAGASSIGQTRKGLDSTERALQISRERKIRSLEPTILMSIGDIHNSLGNRQEALRYFNEALKVGSETNEWTGRATVLNNMGLIYSDIGEIDKAIDLYEESISASEVEGEPEGAASALNGIALIYSQRAEPLKALMYHQKALALVRAVKHQSREATALINIASVYASFNQPEQAIKANNDAVTVFRAVENPAGEALALSNLGGIYNSMGRYREALDSLNRSLEIHRASENRYGQAHTLRNLAYTYESAGNQAKAVDVYTEALALMTAVEDRAGEAATSNNLGHVFYKQGLYQKASEYYLRALRLAHSASDLRGEATIYSNLAVLREEMGNLKEAEEFYGQAIKARERVRATARLDEFKTVIADTSAELYSRAILLKIKLGKVAEAFELSEKAKARTLLDQMNSIRINMHKSSDLALINQEQSLRFELASLEKKLREKMAQGGTSEAYGPLRERLEQGRQAYAEIVIRLKASNPEYAELQGHSPTSLVETQRLLGPETTLISYFVTASKILIFVVTRNSLNVFETPAGEKELRREIDWFRSFASLRAPELTSLKQLDKWLIAPIRQFIKTPMVCVIPHAILHQLPFAALHDGKSYFGEQHTIYYMPAASLLPSIEKRRNLTGQRMLALSEAKAEGWPSLHYVDQEAEAVARMYKGKALLSGQASKAEFLRLAGEHDIIHIASHAELNVNSPLFSRILLTPDEAGNQGFEVREIYDLNLNHTSLVVLSACETQLGAQSRGDDIVGLNRAFIYAGASTVIASLWTVDDKATGLLMHSFYTHLKRGIGKAEALRAAQSETRRQYPNPYYWAAFVLTGDAGQPEKNRR